MTSWLWLLAREGVAQSPAAPEETARDERRLMHRVGPRPLQPTDDFDAPAAAPTTARSLPKRLRSRWVRGDLGLP